MRIWILLPQPTGSGDSVSEKHQDQSGKDYDDQQCADPTFPANWRDTKTKFSRAKPWLTHTLVLPLNFIS